MYYLYFLPKPSHPILGDKPWGAPQRLGFTNAAYAQFYLEQLRQHHHAVCLVKGTPPEIVNQSSKSQQEKN